MARPVCTEEPVVISFVTAALTQRQQSITQIVTVLMADSRMTRRGLAEEIGMLPASLGQTLNGKRRWSIEDLEAMAEVFDVPVSRFFGGSRGAVPGIGG